MELMSLKELHERSGHQITRLQREIADVTALALAVKAGLKESSALLLPNIHREHSEVRAATIRHGSLLSVTSSLVSPPASPGPRKGPPTKAIGVSASNASSQAPSRVGHGGMAWT